MRCYPLTAATGLLLYFVLIGGAASVVWFFQMRRAMILRQRGVITVLEQRFKPIDKEYTLLGYLVGFRAVYSLRSRSISRAWILYIMPPYHVFFYLPVIALARRVERLEVTLRVTYPLPGEAHVFDASDKFVYRSVVRDVMGAGRSYSTARIEVAGRAFTAYYTGQVALEKALQLLRTLYGRCGCVKRVSIVDRLHAIHVSVASKEMISVAGNVAEGLLKVAEAWAKPRG